MTLSYRSAFKNFQKPPQGYVAVDNTPRGKTMRAWAARCVAHVPTAELFIKHMVAVGELTQLANDDLTLLIHPLPASLKFVAIWRDGKALMVAIEAYGRAEQFNLEIPMTAGANTFVHHAAWGSNTEQAMAMFAQKFVA